MLTTFYVNAINS